MFTFSDCCFEELMNKHVTSQFNTLDKTTKTEELTAPFNDVTLGTFLFSVQPDTHALAASGK